ncbi:MAG: ABC transporter permease [Treponema sp.]|jgi:peptide/nickel transport system permease protein|nr:ABC transporter permease [Treponema sp.]
MFKYAVKRLFTLIPVFLVVSMLTFVLGSMSSGDAARILAERRYEHPTFEQIEGVRIEMGLDKPLVVQYGQWLGNALRGNLGTSFWTDRPVVVEIALLFPKTLELALLSLLLLVLISLPLGLASAVFRDTWIDRLTRAYCIMSASMPQFWLALLLLYILGARLGIVSVIGGSKTTYPLLPALTTAVCMGGIYVQLVRTNMEEILSKGYVRAARAKGLREPQVITKHALKNALLPVLSKLGMAFGGLLSGSSIMESIFSWNGLGKYALESIKTKNFPVVQGYVLFMAFLVVCINLLVDLICGAVDPRLKLR